MFGRNKKIDAPRQPREIRISRSPYKKTLKWIITIFLIAILGIGAWIGLSANSAIKKITADSDKKSSLFSFLGDKSAKIKGENEGRTNILLLGMGGGNHPGGQLSDTMIVASIDYDNNQLGLISIPRDLWVPIPGFNSAKINTAYSDGENNKKTAGSGGQLSSKTVENVLGIPIHYYLSLDFEGFKKLIDIVGGVDIYVEKDIYDPSYPADNMIDYSPFKLSAGLHHMDGALALKYVRSRKTTSDFDRSRRQQQVMSAVKENMLSLNILANPKKITDIINILGNHVKTNMQVEEIMALWGLSKNIDTANVTSKVLDTATDGPLTSSQDSRGYYIYPKKGITNFSDLQSMAKNLFKPEEEDLSAIRVEVLNGTNTQGIAKSASQYIASYGYNVTKIGDAPNTIAKTIVYDYSNGKYGDAAKTIADQLNASIDTKDTIRSGVDIQVIVGEDYVR